MHTCKSEIVVALQGPGSVGRGHSRPMHQLPPVTHTSDFCPYLVQNTFPKVPGQSIHACIVVGCIYAHRRVGVLPPVPYTTLPCSNLMLQEWTKPASK